MLYIRYWPVALCVLISVSLLISYKFISLWEFFAFIAFAAACMGPVLSSNLNFIFAVAGDQGGLGETSLSKFGLLPKILPAVKKLLSPPPSN